ncbi:MAG: phytanoyl-CoA dioxygenase family protein [Myxococcales bacterium]|nr:phytanoyl-CoA dioxygenase family protein [Myxococcales bacterium]
MQEKTDSFELRDVASWKNYLREQGYVVVRGALTDAQASEALDGFWAIMEALSSVRRDDARTHSRGTSWPPMLHGGMIQYLAHTPIQWALRSQCAKVFAALWDTSERELATSFDGLCFMHGARGYRSGGDLVSFLHTDQHYARREDWSVQGIVNLADCGPDDGGLVVVPGSHREHAGFFATHAKRASIEGDWYLFDERERRAYEARALKVCAKAGDVLLFDSRTFHCNTVPTRRDAIRACAYVCQLPAKRVSYRVRAKRLAAVREGRVSSHHPGEGFKLFPSLPRFVTGRDAMLAKIRALQAPLELDALQRSLVCGPEHESLFAGV